MFLGVLTLLWPSHGDLMGAQAAKLRAQVEEYERRLAEDPNCLTPKELTGHETVKS